MPFSLKSLNRSDLTIKSIDWENKFLPSNTDFYSYALSHGITKCPTLVPTFRMAFDKEEKCVCIETLLLTSNQYKDGIVEYYDNRIDALFKSYIKEKYHIMDVFNINTPIKAKKAIWFITNDSTNFEFSITKAQSSSIAFYRRLKSNNNGRYKSWEYCYLAFMNARVDKTDIDLLCLQLSFYLASWGMYRGSSFLLQRDYKIHEKAVKEILNPKWNILVGVDCDVLMQKENLYLLEKLSKKISKVYDGIRKNVYEEMQVIGQREMMPENEISKTLITKVLMGTLGCVPAYDRFFCSGVKLYNITSGTYNTSSILSLTQHYATYYKDYESLRRKMKLPNGRIYPQMKVLDMAFWQIGFEEYNRANNKQPINSI